MANGDIVTTDVLRVVNLLRRVLIDTGTRPHGRNLLLSSPSINSAPGLGATTALQLGRSVGTRFREKEFVGSFLGTTKWSTLLLTHVYKSSESSFY